MKTPLFDDALQISITKLKEWGYLKPNQIKSGTITWGGSLKTASINIRGNTNTTPPYIELNYNYWNEPRSYKIELVTIPSNLGKGKIWYFKCPKTGKRCRKLYSIGGYFFHREAFTGLYETQARSKRSRLFYRVFGVLEPSRDLEAELNKKYFKRYYAGKMTRRYRRLLKKIEAQEQKVTRDMIEKLYR